MFWALDNTATEQTRAGSLIKRPFNESTTSVTMYFEPFDLAESLLTGKGRKDLLSLSSTGHYNDMSDSQTTIKGKGSEDRSSRPGQPSVKTFRDDLEHSTWRHSDIVKYHGFSYGHEHLIMAMTASEREVPYLCTLTVYCIGHSCLTRMVNHSVERMGTAPELCTVYPMQPYLRQVVTR